MTIREKLVELATGAAWVVALAAGLQILEVIFGPANLGGVIFGALLVDLATTRAGVHWDSRERALQPTADATVDASDASDAPKRSARRLALGAAVALAIGAISVGAALALGWCVVSAAAAPRAAFAFAVVRAIGVAVRDELLLRGLPLFFAARAGVPRVVARGFAALASGATIVLVRGATPAAVGLAIASGWLFACLWERDRGAWAAVGAHAAWVLLIGSALHGGLVDLDWTKGELAIGAAAEGPPAWVATFVLVAASLAVLRRFPLRAPAR